MTMMVKVVQWAIKGTRRDAACGEVAVEVSPIRRTIITGWSQFLEIRDSEDTGYEMGVYEIACVKITDDG